MALRITVPFVIDLLVVDDEDSMRDLEARDGIDREICAGGKLVPWLLRRRIDKVLVVNGERLPTFLERQNASRIERQAALERRLSNVAFGREAIEPLARYVAGASSAGEVGVAVQQAVGRMFDPEYPASMDSFQAARDLARWLTLDPLRALWWRMSGRMARSRALIWRLGGDDPACIHATSLALRNVIDTLANMRMLAGDPAVRTGWSAAEAVAWSLTAPGMLLRSCSAPVPFHKRPLQRGTLVLYRLRRMHASTANSALAFARRAWNECPAHAGVPALLAMVWERAVEPEIVAAAAEERRGATRAGFAERMLTRAFRMVNRWISWHSLGKWLGLLNLIALRIGLRRHNLHGTTPPAGLARGGIACPFHMRHRSADGAFNDLHEPAMGRAGARFGRNVALADVRCGDDRRLLDPNPCEVSRRLMTRSQFTAAPSLNLLAAAWLQFQVHDWMSHDLEEQPGMELERAPTASWPDRRMRVRLTRQDPERYPGDTELPPAYANGVTHWWDASQLYGSTLEDQRRVRAGVEGKLRIQPDGRLPKDAGTGIDIVGNGDNWWLGLSLMHTLFAREHNAICERLQCAFPRWGDERWFQTARLVNAALIAKIQTLEWTPAILDHPAVVTGMHGNWWGLLGEGVRRRLGRLFEREALSGIPGSRTDHHAAAYSITEEFVSVYRMHPLLPDVFRFFPVGGSSPLCEVPLLRATFAGARSLVEKLEFPDLFYSFGVENPGALTLFNYPRALQEFLPPDNIRIDLAAMDIFRDRERGVPRYNAFRRLLGLRPMTSFDDLTDNPRWRDELRAVYDGDLEKVDLMSGVFAERGTPRGFGFSDTAFRVFILMASRRLKSDRFFTRDFTPAIYTDVGMDWINENGMRSVLLRHYRELRGVLEHVRNPFAPWTRAR